MTTENITVTEVDEHIVFKIITPSGRTLTIPPENMPHGFQVWNCGIQHIAESAAQILELPVTVEVKSVCTARPKRK